MSAEEIAAEAGREPIDKVERKASDKKNQHPGRQQLPASLPRVERVSCRPLRINVLSATQPQDPFNK